MKIDIRDESGVALIMMFVITAILLLTGVALINSAFFDARMAVRNERQIIAHFQARTGLQIAEEVLVVGSGADRSLRAEIHDLLNPSNPDPSNPIFLVGSFPDGVAGESAFELTDEDPRVNANVPLGHIVVEIERVRYDQDPVDILIEARSTANVDGQEETALLTVELSVIEE